MSGARAIQTALSGKAADVLARRAGVGAAPGLAVPQPPPGAEEAPCSALRDALVDSRERWRDLVLLSADLAFETDARGLLSFVAPDPALGWPADQLVGQPPELLLMDSAARGAFNPFQPDAPLRGRRVWVRRSDGTGACLSFAAAPLRDGEGRIVGARGFAVDVTEQESQDAQVAAALRRGEVIDHVLWRMRQEVLAPRMMQGALEAVLDALGAEGAAVLDMLEEAPARAVLHEAGSGAAETTPAALRLLATDDAGPAFGRTDDGRPLLVCPTHTRFGERIGLALWRGTCGREWDMEERMLASSVAGVVRIVLEHAAIQREMARQARTDPLTGLLNRRAFLDEMAKRIDRLERESLPGTLMFVDLDNFKPLNDGSGHDAGDAALCLASTLLRNTVRPVDLVARLGGDEFALWLDGADELTAAERAESLRLNAPAELAQVVPDCSVRLSMSIGIACRRPGQGEDVDSLLRRADAAMYEVKRAGRGHWRVSHAAPV